MATLQAPRGTPLFLKPGDRSGLGAPRRELSADEIEEIRFAFDTLDYEKQGAVQQKQLKVALRAMGFPCTKKDVVELLRRWGEEDSERLEWGSFLRAVSEKMQERSPLDDLKRAFRLFDVHGQGKIDVPTLRKVRVLVPASNSGEL